jgi:NADH dehydrogenase [ubiquinone] 1 alpha subcomplex assembly factor 7
LREAKAKALKEADEKARKAKVAKAKADKAAEVARKKAWDEAKAKALKVVEAAKKTAKAAKEKADDMIKKHDAINKLKKIALHEAKEQLKEQGKNSTTTSIWKRPGSSALKLFG